MKILLIKGQSRYGALRLYIDEFAKELKKLGDEVYVIDAIAEGADNTLISLIEREKHFDYLLSCNAMFTELFANQLSGVVDRFASYVTDHPASHFQRLSKANDKCVIFCLDERHKLFVDRFYDNIEKCYFVPLSGSRYNEDIPFDEKENRLVFTGSYSLPQTIYNTNTAGLSKNMIVFVDMVIEYVVNNPTKTVEDGIEHTLEALGVESSSGEELMMTAQLAWINSYLEMFFRDAVIRKIVGSGIEMHIFGVGWEAFEADGKELITFHDFNTENSLEFVAKSTLSLNVMPWFRAGFQERIANAMLNGTVAVTDNTEYIEREFADGENIVHFSLNNIDELISKLRFYLDDRDAARYVAENGCALAREQHTWDNRVAIMRRKMNGED